MIEPATATLGLGAIAAYLGKDGLQKLLGPTADYLGGGLRDLTKKRAETIGKIFKNASDKIGEDLDSVKAVPPKVLKEIIDDGSFSDQPLEIEYLGGVLASSRSNVPRDNRGASVLRLINSLSNYQLRAHYLIYSSIKRIFENSASSLDPEEREKMKVFIPLAEFLDCMEFNQEELSRVQSLMGHTFFGLDQQKLIEGGFLFGPAEYLQQQAPGAPSPGIVCQPSPLGFEVYLWAFGQGHHDIPYVFDSKFKPDADGVPFGVMGASPVSSLLHVDNRL